jgi:hypothetical protein
MPTVDNEHIVGTDKGYLFMMAKSQLRSFSPEGRSFDSVQYYEGELLIMASHSEDLVRIQYEVKVSDRVIL